MSKRKLFNLHCPHCHESLICDHIIEGGLPAIKILVRDESLKPVFLSPAHGDYSVETGPNLDLEKGKIYPMICPHCGVELTAEPDPCPDCQAPRIKFCVSGREGKILDKGAAIICSRSGCHCSNVFPDDVARDHEEFLAEAKAQAWAAAGVGWAIE